MKKLLKYSLFLVCTLFAMNAPAAESPRDPYAHFFNETFGDFSEELERAREEGKQGVMIFFEMDECPFCHWMKLNVLNQPAVQQYYREHFLLFPVDIEGDVEISNFAGKSMSQKDFAFKEHRVRATPVIAFFDLDGKPVHRHTGRTADVAEFMLMGEFVAEDHYKETRFTRYKRENRN
jgi:thioredoxin-related protein